MTFLEIFTITIILHPSIPSDVKLIKGEINSETILLDGLIQLLSKYEKVTSILLDESDIRPGYLLLSNKIELKTTRKLYSPVISDMEIKIIPISHGG